MFHGFSRNYHENSAATMATFKICVYEHQKRTDEKYPVSIRVYWKRQIAYIGTEFYVTAKQVSKVKYLDGSGKKRNRETLSLKDVFILNELNRRIAKYEEIKSKKLGYKIEMYSARELVQYFVRETRPGTDSTIDFIGFARAYAQKLKSQGRITTSRNINRTVNAIVDYCNGRERVPVTEVTYKFLKQFETFLRSKRTIKRKNQHGKTVITESKGVGDVTLYDYMNDIRVLFNAAMDEYNDEDKDEIRIMHYPFRKYKLQQRPESGKRNLTGTQIRAIRDVPDEKLKLSRAIFARDMIMLSFYLVGANFIDLFEMDKYKGGRISYERSKTRGRRVDRAFISIRVEPEAVDLIEKYRDKTGERVFDFYKRYAEPHNFSSNVNKGLKIVAKACKVEEPVSTYYARHSWATIARNKCDISKDDVDLALNHVDQGKKMADVYIEKDWSRIDAANRKVLDYIKMA